MKKITGLKRLKGVKGAYRLRIRDYRIGFYYENKIIEMARVAHRKSEKFGLISQLRRASVSVASNISEGASRKSKNERTRFYEISRSSLVELDTQIEISIKLGYLQVIDIKKLKKLANEVFAMLSAMI